MPRGRLDFEPTATPDDDRRYGISTRERELAMAEALVRSYEEAQAGRTYSMDDLRSRHEAIRRETARA